MKAKTKPNAKALAILKTYFKRNGYIRTYDLKRRKKENSQAYKKGYEVRLTAFTQKELKEIRSLLLQVGFKPSKSWKKFNRIVQPVYGKKGVELFMGIPIKKVIKKKAVAMAKKESAAQKAKKKKVTTKKSSGKKAGRKR